MFVPYGCLFRFDLISFLPFFAPVVVVVVVYRAMWVECKCEKNTKKKYSIDSVISSVVVVVCLFECLGP